MVASPARTRRHYRSRGRMNRTALFSLLFLVGGCNFTPKRQPPDMEIPAHFKEGGDWKTRQARGSPAAGRLVAHLP